MVTSTTPGPYWKIKTNVCMFPIWEPLHKCFEGTVIDWNQTPPVFYFIKNAAALIVFYSMYDAAKNGGGMGKDQLDNIFQFFFEQPGNPSPGKYSGDISTFIQAITTDLGAFPLLQQVNNEVVLTQFNTGGAAIPIDPYKKPKIELHGKPECPDPGAVVAYPVPRCCG